MKSKKEFLCRECGDTFAKWMGRCPSCGEWNSIHEFHESRVVKKSKNFRGKNLFQEETAKLVPEISLQKKIQTKINEVDRVLGNGFFPGSFLLFGGNPGIGKSTLALQIFLNVEEAMYFSGEESVEQVFHRVQRIDDFQGKKRHIYSTNALEDIVETIEKNKPPLAIIDSIQMVGLENSSLGQLSQIKESAEILLQLSKSTQTTILVIGHVTKNEEIAGPKILEHIVDVVLQLEGEKNSEMRILRSPKNRFGSTLEVGVFEMTSLGLKQLTNPSELFLSERAEHCSGSAITVVREGSRNFLVEIQSLMNKTHFGIPRRTAHGVDISKLHLLLAVVSKFTPFKCEEFDAYLNVVSGFRIKEPAADLAVVAAILSSRAEKEIPADTIIIGEVGLSGEIRSVTQIESRLIEAEKLGFRRAIIPRVRGKFEKKQKIKVCEVRSILELMKEVIREN
jgi:DNA repair protein RadA/Sms